MPPDAADERTLRTLVDLLPRPLPTGNPHAEHTLADILLRLGDYDTAAHYAADSYRRSPSPISAFAVARSAAALGDRDTALGWLRAAESLAAPAWINQALQQCARSSPSSPAARRRPATSDRASSSTTCAASFFGAIRQYDVRISSSISLQSTERRRQVHAAPSRHEPGRAPA